MNAAHPDDPEEVIDMDDGNDVADNSDQKGVQLQGDDDQASANPNIINK